MVTPDNASSNAHPQPPTSGEIPLQILMEEHTRILQVLDALETKTAGWEAGTPPDRVFLEKAVEQFLDEADNARLARQFERFEREETGAGVHEASLKLLDELTGTAR
jgi:hemerythrin-like domain-containing protein